MFIKLIVLLAMRMLVVLALMVPGLTSGDTMPDLKARVKQVNPKLTLQQSQYITGIITHYADIFKLDPYLVAAVIAVESKFNPKAVGSLGELGLMQLRPEYHGKAVADLRTNLITGIEYLALMRVAFSSRYSDSRWLEHYNQGPNKKPKKFPYTKKVLAYYHQFGGEF